MEAERLVQMANQIARNLCHEANPATAIAEHLRLYWPMRMLEGLAALRPDELHHSVIAALGLISQPEDLPKGN